MAKKKAKEAKKFPNKLWEKYAAEGETVKKKNPTCPKCGPAVFLAKHKDRETCGQCGYTKFGGRKESAKTDEGKKDESKKDNSKKE